MPNEKQLIYLEDAVSLLEKEIVENQDALKYAYHGDKNAIRSEISALRSAITTLKQHANRGGTVDAAKVVHAEWLDIRFDSMWRSMLATCSHCKVRGEVRVKSNECGFAVPDSDYCPHCGAKMDGGV